MEYVTKYRNRLFNIAFKKNAKGEDVPAIDPLKMILMFEKLGKLKEFYMNANNWNYSMRNQMALQNNTTVNIYAKADQATLQPELKSIGQRYRERIEALRQTRGDEDNIVSGEVIENEESQGID